MLMMVHRLASAVQRVLLLAREATLNIQDAQILLKTDIVVRKLAHVVVVHADDFGLLGRAHAEEGDEVHDPEDDGGHDERVCEAGGRVGELVAELDPVVVEPTAVDLGDSVETGHGGLGEEGGEDVADDTADPMDGEDIEGVVVVKEELELGGKVARGGADNTVENGGSC